ncbi:fungal-specific transcription factor domain-containing protein [Aspergillus spectabilis]
MQKEEDKMFDTCASNICSTWLNSVLSRSQGDMRPPTCSLCARTGSKCVFPTRRKQPTRKSERSRRSIGLDDGKLRRLAKLLESNDLERLLTTSPERGLVGSSSITPDFQAAAAQLDQMSNTQWQQLLQIPGPSEQRLASAGSFGTPSANTLDTSWPMIRQDLEESGCNQDFIASPIAEHFPSEFRNPPLHLAAINIPLEPDPKGVHDLPGGGMAQNPPDSHGLMREQELSEHFMSLDWQAFEGGNSGSTTTGDAGPTVETSLFTIDISADHAKHLLDLFFSHIQCFLPLLHRPRCYSEFDRVRHCLGGEQQLDLQTALLFNGIFALSARFSQRSEFSACEPKDQGEQFARKSRGLFDHWRQSQDGDVTLKILQGSILMTFYQLSSGLDFKGLVAAGICCRMAYTLSLHRTDVGYISSPPDEGTNIDVEEWTYKEERRRAWWACWELDTFSSTVACQPPTIDLSRLDVHLPVSDEAWFNMKPVSSALLASRKPLEVWKSLKGSPNQNDYAWYLISNCLMRQAQQMFESREASSEVLNNFQSSVNCYALTLPARFSISPANITFNETTFSSSNYIIGTHIMLQNANIYATLLAHREESQPSPPATLNDNCAHDSPTSSSLYRPAAYSCTRYTDEVIRAVRLWSPDFMAMASPFLVCAIPGPFGVHFRTTASEYGVSHDINKELLELVIKHQASYWGLASMLLDFHKTLRDSNRLAPHLDKFQALMPGSFPLEMGRSNEV